MTTITELSTAESVDLQNHCDYYIPKLNLTVIDINCITRSSNINYNNFIINNSFLHCMTASDEDRIKLHFLVSEIFNTITSAIGSVCFFCNTTTLSPADGLLIKSVFNALPTRIIYSQGTFKEFLDHELTNYFLLSKDYTRRNLTKLRKFLKANKLFSLEKEFVSNVNIKLSLLT